MKSVFVLGAIGASGLVAWLASDFDDPPKPMPASRAAPSPEPALLVDREWLGEELLLPRASNGHFYADVAIDDVSLNMMIDTGASVIALTGADAEALGLMWTADEVQPVARGAGGTVHGVPVQLDRVQLGPLEQRSVAAIVVPEGLSVSLLGQSFLSRIERVEIAREHMRLGG